MDKCTSEPEEETEPHYSLLWYIDAFLMVLEKDSLSPTLIIFFYKKHLWHTLDNCVVLLVLSSLQKMNFKDLLNCL